MANLEEEQIHVDGKTYTVILRSDGTSTALRYGEAWPAFAGQNQLDNLTVALARDLQTARENLSLMLEAVSKLNVKGKPITDLDTTLAACCHSARTYLAESE